MSKEYKISEEENKVSELNEAMVTYGAVDDRSVYTIIEAIRNGLSFEYFIKLVKRIPFSLSEWSEILHLSDRTMLRYKKQNGTFDPLHSEKILEISMLFKKGVEVFGDADNFHEWLGQKNIAVGGQRPKDLLDSGFGISLIKDELTRIAYGVLA